jgi:hypothetical protein
MAAHSSARGADAGVPRSVARAPVQASTPSTPKRHGDSVDGDRHAAAVLWSLKRVRHSSPGAGLSGAAAGTGGDGGAPPASPMSTTGVDAWSFDGFGSPTLDRMLDDMGARQSDDPCYNGKATLPDSLSLSMALCDAPDEIIFCEVTSLVAYLENLKMLYVPVVVPCEEGAVCSYVPILDFIFHVLKNAPILEDFKRIVTDVDLRQMILEGSPQSVVSSWQGVGFDEPLSSTQQDELLNLLTASVSNGQKLLQYGLARLTQIPSSVNATKFASKLRTFKNDIMRTRERLVAIADMLTGVRGCGVYSVRVKGQIGHPQLYVAIGLAFDLRVWRWEKDRDTSKNMLRSFQCALNSSARDYDQKFNEKDVKVAVERGLTCAFTAACGSLSASGALVENPFSPVLTMHNKLVMNPSTGEYSSSRCSSGCLASYDKCRWDGSSLGQTDLEPCVEVPMHVPVFMQDTVQMPLTAFLDIVHRVLNEVEGRAFCDVSKLLENKYAKQLVLCASIQPGGDTHPTPETVLTNDLLATEQLLMTSLAQMMQATSISASRHQLGLRVLNLAEDDFIAEQARVERTYATTFYALKQFQQQQPCPQRGRSQLQLGLRIQSFSSLTAVTTLDMADVTRVACSEDDALMAFNTLGYNVRMLVGDSTKHHLKRSVVLRSALAAHLKLVLPALDLVQLLDDVDMIDLAIDWTKMPASLSCNPDLAPERNLQDTTPAVEVSRARLRKAFSRISRSFNAVKCMIKDNDELYVNNPLADEVLPFLCWNETLTYNRDDKHLSLLRAYQWVRRCRLSGTGLSEVATETRLPTGEDIARSKDSAILNTPNHSTARSGDSNVRGLVHLPPLLMGAQGCCESNFCAFQAALQSKDGWFQLASQNPDLGIILHLRTESGEMETLGTGQLFTVSAVSTADGTVFVVRDRSKHSSDGACIDGVMAHLLTWSIGVDVTFGLQITARVGSCPIGAATQREMPLGQNCSQARIAPLPVPSRGLQLEFKLICIETLAKLEACSEDWPMHGDDPALLPIVASCKNAPDVQMTLHLSPDKAIALLHKLAPDLNQDYLTTFKGRSSALLTALGMDLPAAEDGFALWKSYLNKLRERTWEGPTFVSVEILLAAGLSEKHPVAKQNLAGMLDSRGPNGKSMISMVKKTKLKELKDALVFLHALGDGVAPMPVPDAMRNASAALSNLCLHYEPVIQKQLYLRAAQIGTKGNPLPPNVRTQLLALEDLIQSKFQWSGCKVDEHGASQVFPTVHESTVVVGAHDDQDAALPFVVHTHRDEMTKASNANFSYLDAMSGLSIIAQARAQDFEGYVHSATMMGASYKLDSMTCDEDELTALFVATGAGDFVYVTLTCEEPDDESLSGDYAGPVIVRMYPRCDSLTCSQTLNTVDDTYGGAFTTGEVESLTIITMSTCVHLAVDDVVCRKVISDDEVLEPVALVEWFVPKTHIATSKQLHAMRFVHHELLLALVLSPDVVVKPFIEALKIGRDETRKKFHLPDYVLKEMLVPRLRIENFIEKVRDGSGEYVLTNLKPDAMMESFLETLRMKWLGCWEAYVANVGAVCIRLGIQQTEAQTMHMLQSQMDITLGLADKIFLAITPPTESKSLQMKMLFGYNVESEPEHVYRLRSTNQIDYRRIYNDEAKLFTHHPIMRDTAQFPVEELMKRGMSSTPQCFDLLSCLGLDMQLPHWHFTDANAILLGDFQGLNGCTRVLCVTENPQITLKMCQHHQMYSAMSDQVRKLSAAGIGHCDFKKLKTTRHSVDSAPTYLQRRRQVEALVHERMVCEKQAVSLICNKVATSW